MSASEIFILVLMGIIALQMFVLRWVIRAALDTMKSCSETTDKAADLAMRVLDDLVAAQSPQDGKEARQDG